MPLEIPSLSERLKIFTEAIHKESENGVVRLIHKVEDQQDYARILSLFYSYYKGIEEMIDLLSPKLLLPDFNKRRKASVLSTDILAMHGQLPEILQKRYLPLIENSFQAFGALYVLEGSTLGGTYIVKMIKKKLDATEGSFHFFSGYGDQNLEMWEIFKANLNRLSKNEYDINIVLTAAEDTFQEIQ